MHETTPAGPTLATRVSLPEPGTWYLTDASDEGTPVWARVPREDEGHEDDDAIRTAWERLTALSHPSAPRAVRLDRQHNRLYVAAPDGVPMSLLLEHRHEDDFRMTPGTVLDFGEKLADLLVHAHERGRPHGHLSPDAIWITPDGGLVVWGFGGGPDSMSAARWWSPERARGKRASGDADQWALGALLAALVTGRTPWRSDDPVSEARVGDASHLWGPVMEQWKPLGRVLERALAPETRDRFSSAHPLRQAIEAMQQRAAQPSELPRMGQALWERFGREPLPPVPPDEPLDELDAPPVPRLLASAAPPHEASDPPTTVSDEEPPLDALWPAPTSPLAEGMMEFDAPTDLATSPTGIPDEGFSDRDSQIDEGPEPGLAAPVARPDPSAVAPPASALAAGPVVDFDRSPDDDAVALADEVGDPSSLGLVGVAERTGPEPVQAPTWHERIDIRRIAPVTVGILAVLLVIYALGGWWS